MRLSVLVVLVGLAVWMATEVGPPVYAAVILGVGGLVALGEVAWNRYIVERMHRDAEMMVKDLQKRVKKEMERAGG